MRHVNGFRIGAIAAITLAAGCLLRPQSEPVAKVDGIAPVTLSSPRVPVNQDPVRQAVAATAASATPLETKAQQFNALIRAGTPADAFAAYSLAGECALARRMENQGTPVKSDEVCGDIEPGQITARLQQLDIAIAAGVPGAFLAFMAEGPTGQGFVMLKPSDLSDPVNAAYADKLAKAMKQAALNGDVQAAQSFSNLAEIEHDPATAAAYWVAQELMTRARGGPSAPVYEPALNALTKDLTPDQRQAAIKHGAEIATAAQASPYWIHQ